MEWNGSIASRRLYPNGYFALKPGTVVRVRDCPNGYPLPAGLRPGEIVRITAFDGGYYTVEKPGRVYNIFLTNVAAIRAKALVEKIRSRSFEASERGFDGRKR
jgi:hypothetical protein